MDDQKVPETQLSKRELAKSVLLRGVDLESVLDLLGDGTLQEVKQGDVLIQARQSNRSLYLLLSGRLSIHLEQELEPVAVLGPGDVVGELSLIDGQLTSAYVVADADCHLLVLEEATVWSLLKASDSVARNLLFVLAQRLRHLINQQLRREYAHYTVIDALTGLYNRRWLETMLVREVERSKRDARPLSLLLIGVDHFKEYSARHGPLAMESALLAVASVLQERTRPGEMLARYGGDEFLVLLPDTEAPTGYEIAERLRQAISQAEFSALEQPSLPSVTVSVGVIQMVEADTVEALIAAADEALSKAKAGEGNRVIQSDRPS